MLPKSKNNDLYGYEYETCFLTLKEEHILQVFENKVVRKIFGSKKDKVSKQFRVSHHEKLHDLFRLLSIVTIIDQR